MNPSRLLIRLSELKETCGSIAFDDSGAIITVVSIAEISLKAALFIITPPFFNLIYWDYDNKSAIFFR